MSHPRASSVASLLLIAAVASAQQRSPHVGYVFPAGGQQNTSFEVTVGGQFLDGASAVLFSEAGVRATVVDYMKPPNRGQLNRLRQKLREKVRADLERERQNNDRAREKDRAKDSARGRDSAQGGKDRRRNRTAQQVRQRQRRRRGLGLDRLDAATFKRLALSVRLRNFDLDDLKALMRKLRDPRRQPNAQIAETVTLRVTIDPGATLGRREFRLRTARGLTNPLVFEVGQWREYSERETGNEQADPGIGEELPVLINGQIMPGDVDRFVFKGKKGMRIVAAASARKLVPYLADAVPGWFQATLELFDETGKRLAYVDDHWFHPDPVLAFEVPADGRYVLEIKDAIYRGREDFAYRIALGELPYVTSVFPLGGRAGERIKLRLTGWNLPRRSLTLDARNEKPGALQLAVRKGRQLSNFIPFVLGSSRESLEKEPNDARAKAQPIRLPLIINGRIKSPGDQDCFRFEGRAGEAIVAEIHARRLGSPLDSLLRIFDENGKQLAKSDDHVDPGAGLVTHQADSRLGLELPADGSYLLVLGDTQHQGGPEHAYRLSVARARPDFALRVAPSSINARPGTSVPLVVHAERKDGFSGDILLELQDAPPGFRLSGAWIPAGQERVRLTLTVPPAARAEPLSLGLLGRAKIQGKETRRRAVPAEDMMQAFLYRHLVPAKDLLVMVSGRGRSRSTLRLAQRGPVALPRDGSAWVHVAGVPAAFLKQIKLALSDPPEGISIGKVTAQQDGGLAILLKADAEKVELGQKGNLIIDAFLERSVSRGGQRRRRRVPVGVLPAIPFEIRGRRAGI
ncbi:MAG: hypothetical protein ACE5F1_02270 [Planctomycetota bacterium]